MSVITDEKRINELLNRGIENIFVKEELKNLKNKFEGIKHLFSL